jgi:mRNA interferase HicA
MKRDEQSPSREAREGLFAGVAAAVLQYKQKCLYSVCEKQRVQALLEKQGASFTPGKGSHSHVEPNGRNAILPIHSKDLGKGLVETIKKQLGLK